MSRTTGWVGRHRGTVAVVGVVLVVAALLTFTATRDSGYSDPLDPANPAPGGAQAVARVLDAHGVDVTVVRRAAELDRTTVDADTTVLVTSTDALGRSTARRLDRRTSTAGALVLAEPGATSIKTLRLRIVADGARVKGRTDADCDDPAVSGLGVEVGPSVGYRSTAGTPSEACFRGTGKRPVALLLRLERRVPTYALGGTDVLTNGEVTRGDNAAVALRLLGQHPRLVWYVPDVRDVLAGDRGSLAGQLPGGLVPSLWLVAAAVLATMLWRGRRLGALVTEPLPVVVKAVESTQGRGRLYRRVHDRSHVAEVLREATARRLSHHLRLPPDAGVGQLATAVAEVTGRDPVVVRDLFVAHEVADDATLTHLASELAALEKEVHRP